MSKKSKNLEKDAAGYAHDILLVLGAIAPIIAQFPPSTPTNASYTLGHLLDLANRYRSTGDAELASMVFQYTAGITRFIETGGGELAQP
jgi:hypothetical protein